MFSNSYIIIIFSVISIGLKTLQNDEGRQHTNQQECDIKYVENNEKLTMEYSSVLQDTF